VGASGAIGAVAEVDKEAWVELYVVCGRMGAAGATADCGVLPLAPGSKAFAVARELWGPGVPGAAASGM
jgi:hypothetical protein